MNIVYVKRASNPSQEMRRKWWEEQEVKFPSQHDSGSGDNIFYPGCLKSLVEVENIPGRKTC